MRNRILFVGVGQCGSNIAQLFNNKDYHCLFINTSYEDLETIQAEHKYYIVGAAGCNKDRQKALGYAKEHYNKIINIINTKFPQQDIVYFIFSTSGGTGAGISPIMLDLLCNQNPHKAYGAIMVLPSKKESIRSQVNAVETYKQITEIESLRNVYILDNNIKDKFEINQEFVSLFDRMINITTVDKRGIIDHSELEVLLKSKGCVNIATIKSQDTINSRLEDRIINNIFVSDDSSVCEYIAVSQKDNIHINQIQNIFGTPIDIFTGYNNESNFIVVTGMKYPHSYLDTFVDTIVSRKEHLSNNHHSTQHFQNIIKIKDIIPEITVKTETSCIDSVLKRYV